MKNKFEEPKLVIVYFTTDDIITGSGGLGDNSGEWHDDPEDD